MITLAIDTCDRFGSVGLQVNGALLLVRHHADEDYSSWLLPAVESLLTEAGKLYKDVDLFAVATGPGSFTGVRVGLCTVKAWAEVHAKPVVGVSRLAALARQAAHQGLVAAAYDAHRGQLFAGLYRHLPTSWELIEQEMVIAPEEFLAFVQERALGEAVRWVSLQPELIRDLPAWAKHESKGSVLISSDVPLIHRIAELAEEKAARAEFTDVLQLDANYVRRSDAEIFWKGPAHHAG